MNLLTFAHRGEAQHFLKYDNYKSVDSNFNEFFKNDKNYLLFTGEGLQSTEERMISFLSQSNLNIDRMVNLGIAGALDEKLELESIHSLKQILKENDNETFRSSDVYAKIDCISALNRVTDLGYRDKLLTRAKIIDREIWAIAKVCNNYQLPFYSFKLISDFAGENIDTHAIIKKSKGYSKKLFDFFHEKLNKKEL